MNPPYTIHLHKKPHLSYLICIQAPITVLIPLLNLIQHFIAQFDHGLFIRLNMDSRQSCGTISCQFDILHTPASFFLTTGQDAVMDSLITCFQND